MRMAYLPTSHCYECIYRKADPVFPYFFPTTYPRGHTEPPHAPATKAMHHLTLSRGFLALLWSAYIALSTADKATQELDSVATLRDTGWAGEYDISVLGDR